MLGFSLINQVIVFLINIIGIWLAFWVLWSNKKAKLNQMFFGMTFFILLWVTFGYFSHLPSQVNLALFWKRLNFGAVSLFFVAMYFFTVYFPKEKKRHSIILDKVVSLIGMILFFTSVFTDLIIKEIKFESWGTDNIFGGGKNFFFGAVIFLTFLIVGQLLRKYYKSSKKGRLKIEYFLAGVIIFAFMNVVFNVILPLIIGTYQFYQFGDYSAIILLIFTAYAITKHNLMGIKILLTQTLIVIIAIILLLDIFALSDNLTMQILKAGILIAFLYFSRGMVESVKKEKEARKELQKTYRKVNRYARKLEKANMDLKELLEIKNNFLHITSHQLRTPLTVIRGMLSMWRAGDFDNLSEKEQKEKREKIYLSAERLNNITNDMLDAMEVEGKFLKFNLERVSLENIIRETMDELKLNYDRKGLYLKLNVKGRLPKIKVEPKYLKQALMNLLDNAEKYTLKGGVEIKIKKEKEFILIEIKDTGIGIAKNDQKKLFQKFSRTKNAIKQNATGSGLGLFIAKQIIDEHQGKIEISSEGVGKGTMVKVWLPKN